MHHLGPTLQPTDLLKDEDSILLYNYLISFRIKGAGKIKHQFLFSLINQYSV